ncbi:MAG TPA: hypothetical protein VG826_25280 [Pirellulales bacterium]|nr:hypothetical protein [Pirellulales bacterium]
MAGSRLPGPAGLDRGPVVDVQDGTMVRQAAPFPGPLGRNGDVASWSDTRKLMAAAQRTTDKLPAEMREEFAALFTRQNAAITAAVLAAWGASHAVGAGEAIDAVLVALAVATVGVQAFQGGRELGEFLLLAGGAKTENDLEAASQHLAKAVTLLGVATVTALIMRWRPGAGTAAGAGDAVAAQEEAGELLEMIGLHNKPQGVRDMVAAFVRFTTEEMPELSRTQKANYLKAMDLSKFADAGEETLRPGTRLVSKVQGAQGTPGNWFTTAGTPNEQIGISSGAGSATRVQKVYVVKKPVKAFRSRAAPTVDTWTQGRAPQVAVGVRPGVAKYGEYVGGGGVQYLIPDWSGALE